MSTHSALAVAESVDADNAEFERPVGVKGAAQFLGVNTSPEPVRHRHG